MARKDRLQKVTGMWVLFNSQLVRIIGLVLVFAALIKASSVARNQYLPDSIINENGQHFLAIFAEIVIGILLFTRPCDKKVTFAATGLFVWFFFYSTLSVISGKNSCGCLGDIRVPPILMSGFDALFIVILITGIRKETGPDHATSLFRAIVAVLGLSAIAFGLEKLYSPVDIAKLNPGNLSSFASIDLKLDYWDEQVPPWLDYVKDARTLREGVWSIAFLRHGCEKCDRFLDELARGKSATIGNVAILSVDGQRFTTFSPELKKAFFVHDLRWICNTPSVVIVDRGVQRLYFEP